MLISFLLMSSLQPPLCFCHSYECGAKALTPLKTKATLRAPDKLSVGMLRLT